MIKVQLMESKHNYLNYSLSNSKCFDFRNMLRYCFYSLALFLSLNCASRVFSQTICNPAGNLIIYSNYDGGIVTINVDQNIPNLIVGICTYEPVQVTFTGPFVGNITEVIYAGFNSAQNNNNCGQGNFSTSISGIAAGLISINPPQNPPSVGYTPAHGNGAELWGGLMIGTSGQCDTLNSAGGGNTPDEIVYYFENQTGAQLYFHHTQYNCYLNNTFNISDGGTCCIEPPGTNPTNICDVNGNMVLYSNYEGGILNINVDQNIPNLKIGICSYEATEVNFSGPFVGNITEVIYAGFNGQNNTNCGSNIATTAINGVAPGIVTIYSGSSGSPAIANYLGEALGPGLPPLVNCMVGADGNCSGSNVGGGNSSPQIVQFFLAEFGFGTTLFSHTTNYSCFSGTYSISNGGNCCLSAPNTAPNPIYTGGSSYDFIPDSYDLCNGPLSLDLSSYPVLFQPPIYPGYVWSNGATGPIVTLNTPGIYSFTVGDYCHSDPSTYLTDTIEILACNPCTNQISSTILNLQNVSCFGESNGSCTIEAGGGNGPYNYTWSPGNLTGPIQNNLASGTYIVSITDADNCSLTDTIIISEPAIPLSGIISKIDADCLDTNGSASITASGGTSPYSYFWTPSGSSAATISNLSGGLYSVTLTDQNGCSFDTSITIETTNSISVNFSLSDKLLSWLEPTVTVLANSDSQIVNWDWTSDGAISILSQNESAVITYPIGTAATYIINLLVTSDNGCQGSISLPIIIEPEILIYIPNTFTPDNNELNQTFDIFISGIDLVSYNLKIFNRWGEIIWESFDVNTSWDGTYNGLLVPFGTYNWQLTYREVSGGENIVKTGSVNVVK